MHVFLQDIKDYTGADDEFIVRLFDKFLDHINNDIVELVEKTDNEDWYEVKKTSHLMLSSARIFALKKIISLHEEIEKSCDSGTTDKIPALVHELTKLYKDSISEIELLKKQLNPVP